MRNRLAWIGSVITAIYLTVFIWFVFGRLPELQTMALNNVGDFLAGAFGPIAFFWLILGFMQQGTELRMSADALRMQADELKASVQQQTALVAAQQVNLENHERSLEPLLELKYTGYREVDGEFYSSFSLSSFGNYCESVNVHLDGVSKHPISLEPLYKGVPRTFLLSDMDGMFQIFHLEVHYKKLSGRENFQVFELTAFEDESGPQVRIKKRPLKNLTATP